MNKSALVLLCLATVSYAMEPEGLYLVIGSTRCKAPEYFVVEQLWQEKDADLSHTKTYGGKATTMDKGKSILPGVKHIVADACEYTFKKDSIRGAYLERLPTLNVADSDNGLEIIGSEKNYLGACIQNVGRAMVAGAVIEVEWHPFVRFSRKDIKTVTSLYDEKNIKKDPFTMTINENVAWNAVGKASTLSFIGGSLPEQFIGCVNTLSEKLEQLIDFYEQEHVGTKKLLKKRLWEEKSLIEILSTHKAVLLAKGPEANLQEFTHAIDDFIAFEREDSILNYLYYTDPEELGEKKLYNLNAFLKYSLYYLIVSDALIESHSPFVKEFMHNSGFKDVILERKQSPHNGRKNVWIITGVKV